MSDELPLIPPIGYAFLDALSVGESNGDYMLFYGGKPIPADQTYRADGWPDWDGIRTRNGTMTHAAGRYQFEPTTWTECAAALRLTDFGDDSQDAAAWWLAQRTYRTRTGNSLVDDLSNGKRANVATALQSTWTSLSSMTFPERFRGALMAAERQARWDKEGETGT